MNFVKTIKKNMRIYSATLLLGSILFSVPSFALNYGNNYNEDDTGGHNDMIRNILQLVKEYEGELIVEEGDDESWIEFVNVFNQTREKLAGLTVDMGNPYFDEYHKQTLCFTPAEENIQLPLLEAQINDEEYRVANIEYSHTIPGSMGTETKKCYTVYFNPAQHCAYDPADNMKAFHNKLISEIPQYINFERKWTSGSCFMGITNSIEDRYQALGYVLGRWAAKVDDLGSDRTMWFKVSNTIGGKILTEIETQTIQTSWTLANPFVALVAGFRCLGRLFSGKSCDFNHYTQRPPIEELKASVNGVGSHKMSKYTGMWHMMNVDREGYGEYNDIPGTDLEWAGPGGNPGALDMVVMAAVDLTGLTIHAAENTGVKNYGPYDDTPRVENWQWQIENMGHIEFASLSSLGEYGWAEFKKDPSGSKNLGWPLHALGDTSVPHHLVGTMSYGHGAYENAMSTAWHKLFWEPRGLTKYDVIQNAYRWWKEFCWDSALQEKKDLASAKKLIEAVAVDNKQFLGNWAWDDSATSKDKKENRYLLDPAFAANASQLVSNSSGATLALLMSASDMVVSKGHDPATDCPDGYGYCATWQCDFQCTEGFAGYDPTTMEPVDGFNVGVLNSGDCAIQACVDHEDCENLGEDENGRYWCSTTGCCIQIYVE